MGHHPRVLDLLHESDSATVCGPCAWNGSRRFLARGVDGEIVGGEIQGVGFTGPDYNQSITENFSYF